MRLILGDCLEALRELPDGSVDAVIADPPYGTTACKWDSVLWFAPMWEALWRVAKPNAPIVLFSAQPFSSALVMSNPSEFRHEWVWRKTRGSNFASAKKQPLKVHESVMVFARQRHTYNPQMREGKPYKTRAKADRGGTFYGTFTGNGYNPNEVRTQRYPLTVIDIPSMRQQDLVHPTQKPVDLMAYLVRTYTNPGEVVLDFCFGSGTTGVACVREGRDFIGIERDAGYFAVAEKRLAAESLPLFAAAD